MSRSETEPARGYIVANLEDGDMMFFLDKAEADELWEDCLALGAGNHAYYSFGLEDGTLIPPPVMETVPEVELVQQELPFPKFELELGCWYRNNDGVVIGPLKPTRRDNAYVESHPFCHYGRPDIYYTYTPEGYWCPVDSKGNPEALPGETEEDRDIWNLVEKVSPSVWL
jgi:hypothetical protein